MTAIATTATGSERRSTAAALEIAADRRIRLFNRVCAGVLVAFALIWLVPLAWAVDTAFKPNAETTRTTWLIDNPTLESFRTLLAQGDILNWYAASFITSKSEVVEPQFGPSEPMPTVTPRRSSSGTRAMPLPR